MIDAAIERRSTRAGQWIQHELGIQHEPAARRAAPFFAERFSSMRWSILTPDLSAHWNLQALSFTSGVPAPVAHATGDVEELWRVYYASVFNPARANLRRCARCRCAAGRSFPKRR